MKFLIIGNGGREDAIAWRLIESAKVSKVHMLPSSVRKHPKFISHDISIDNHDEILKFALEKKINLIVIGPEKPLCNGLSDLLRENGLKVFGPSKAAAKLEGSKTFAKQIMKKYNIPTADFMETSDYSKAIEYIKEKDQYPIVIKADGIAAGKGVLIAKTFEEASHFLKEVLEEDIFNSGKQVVIEEFLVGSEFSLLAFVNKTGIYPMKIVKDYKKAFDNDKGLNTGGMGAVTPVRGISSKDVAFGVEKIIKPTIEGLKKEGIEYEGVIYAGLMKTKNGIYTIEFNARFGDPETEALMLIIKNDIADLFKKLVNHRKIELEYTSRACIGVVIAKEGYPKSYTKNIPLDLPININYFNMATTLNENNKLVSNGGRVVFAYELANTINEAKKNIYKKLKAFDTKNEFFFRTDIGKEK